MTGTRAASLLDDILKWKLQLTPPEPGVRSVPTDTDGIRSADRDRLPFGLDQVIDTSWGDGPAGTTTEAGVDQWLRFWVPWFSYWVDQPARYRQSPGAWMLTHLQEDQVFDHPEAWADDDLAAWQEFTGELQTMWRRLARATGNAPHNAGICPKCLTGTLHQHPNKTGYSDTATCNQCNAAIPTHDLERARRQSLRNITVADDKGETWIYGKQAIDLYGNQLTWAHLRDWHKQGKLPRRGHRRNYQYPLAQLNALVVDSQ